MSLTGYSDECENGGMENSDYFLLILWRAEGKLVTMQPIPRADTYSATHKGRPEHGAHQSRPQNFQLACGFTPMFSRRFSNL